MAGPDGVFVVVGLALAHFAGFMACEGSHLLSSQVCSTWRLMSRISLAAFMAGGANLRRNKKLVENLLIPIVPPPLPPRACVYLSGLAELLCGVVLIMPGYEQLGAGGIVLLLLAVFPANVYHACSAHAHKLTRIGPPAVYWRLPIQGLFIGWARWHMTSSII